MYLKELSLKKLNQQCAKGQFLLQTGPFLTKIQTKQTDFIALLQKMYGESVLIETPEEEVYHFAIGLQSGRGLHRIFKPQIRVKTDTTPPFTPFPQSHAFALFEWALNWCIALQSHQYLMLHSAVLEKNNQALLLPAEPGSGKSTLCAALMLKGWRLLSDEFTLVHPEKKVVYPLPRPIPLKNESIEIIRQFSDQAVLGPLFEKTRKGDVSHLQPTAHSLHSAAKTARTRWIIFPQYQQNSQNNLTPFAKGRSFLKLTGNAFNYRLQGARGFNALTEIIDQCDTYYLEFSQLEAALELIEKKLGN